MKEGTRESLQAKAIEDKAVYPSYEGEETPSNSYFDRMDLKPAHGWAKRKLKLFLGTSEALKQSFLSVSLAEG